MKPTLSFFCTLTICMIASCGPGISKPQPTPTPTASSTPVPTPQPTQPACIGLSINPTPGPDTPSLFRPVSRDDHARGASEAAVTFVIYIDFQCVECNYLSLFQRLLEAYPGDLRLIVRPYPYTPIFDKGDLAARAVEAAAQQGKFWELHDLLLESQNDWVNLSPEAFGSWITDIVEDIGLDQAQFGADLKSAETIQTVEEQVEEGTHIGIPSLPFYLLNGQIYRGPVTFQAISQVIDLIKLGERQFSSCPPIVIDPDKQYTATLETEKGEILLLLYAEGSPLTVNSFVFLARQGWFDDITFHRVLPGFIAQSGDPSGTGQGHPGYMFIDEIDPERVFDQAGLVAMANSGPDTNGSQFFITNAPAPHLNGEHTIFGIVLSGMEVVESLSPRDPQPGLSLPLGDELIRVTIEEK